MGRHRNRIFINLTVVGLVLTVGLIYLSTLKVKESVREEKDFAININAQEQSKEDTVEVGAPDGKATLTMKNKKKTENVVTQTFSITTEKEKTPVKIFEKDSDPNSLVSIPYNTFSPNDRFVLLKYEEAGKPQYIVIRTDGKDIKKDSQTVEITGPFYERYPDFVITDVTGWGGNGLIVVNTDFKDGKTGPSWWFDTSSFGFIRLSTRFN